MMERTVTASGPWPDRLGIAGLLAGLFLVFHHDAAGSDATLLNGGRPIEVRVLSTPADHSADRLPPVERKFKPSPGAVSRPQAVAAPPLLQLPLRPTIGHGQPGYYAISNFVDQDEDFPDNVLDYNCGERTYDTASGLNHNGIDYSLPFFVWRSMADETTAIVAAADGTIIERHDGEPDMNCAFDENADPNVVTLQHADGSITLYAHMKSGTVTPRQVGDKVEAGDYLGMVGSSGLSTGPHLHLGVYDSGQNLIEPFSGACNDLNDESWWLEQEPYYNKTILAIATHDAQPEYPPCPQPEIPHLQNVFQPGGPLYFSGVFRDIQRNEIIHAKITAPSSQTVLEFDYGQDSHDFAEALSVIWGVNLPGSAAAGKYQLALTYNNATALHDFYISAQPPAPPAPVVANNAYNGLWYDPALEGEGYNFVFTPSGGIIYFYGSDARGNRIWLISDAIPGTIGTNGAIEVAMYESTGGTFATPVKSSRGLSAWGTLELEFGDCSHGVATLHGADGDKVSNIVKLASVAGTNCTAGAVRSDNRFAGLWYDPANDGEGYNLIVAPNGSILYFYGFKEDGLRLWLISDLITDTLQIGEDAEIDVYESTTGTFGSPVPSGNALQKWGEASIRPVDCNHIRIELDGDDGAKVSNTVRLASVIGINCT